MKIAVIGSGGAGLTTAWLLDERHDVVVYERGANLGGHARTTAVDLAGTRVASDEGFSWFSDALYPRFVRLLELHGVATRIVPMSATFTDRRRARTLVMPPVAPGALLRTVLSSKLADMLRLDRAIRLAAPMVHNQEHELSWGEFLRRHRFEEPFVRDLLTPMVAGVWGGPYERAEDFCAYTLMKYLVFHRPSGLSHYRWHVVLGGAAAYIDRVAASLARTTLLRRTPVQRLERDGDGWIVVDDAGGRRRFDHVVCAVGAPDARRLLGDARGLEREREVLGRFEYYSARVATHGDASVMPARRSDWRVCNIGFDGERSHLSVWAGRYADAPIFTSYVGASLPEPCYHVSTFHLPLITPAHYRAQAALPSVQGRERVWFAGDWTRDIGSHEDAVVSAIGVARALDPSLTRLGALESPRVHAAGVALPAGPALPQAAPAKAA